jgi:CBS domain-containing protein
MKVKDVMTTRVITVREEQTKQQAARLLSQHQISGLPVVKDDNLLVGVVTEYDVIAKEGKTVGDIMTRGAISVSADTDLKRQAIFSYMNASSVCRCLIRGG